MTLRELYRVNFNWKRTSIVNSGCCIKEFYTKDYVEALEYILACVEF